MLVVTLNGMKLLPSSHKVRQNELRARMGTVVGDSGRALSVSEPLLESSNNSDADGFVDEDRQCCSSGGCNSNNGTRCNAIEVI